MLKSAGLNLTTIAQTLDENVAESKAHLKVLAPVMDTRTRLNHKIKILELELFTELLKQQAQ